MRKRLPGMLWLKSFSGDISDPKIAELQERFGCQGYFFREHLFKLLAAYFNIFLPGKFRFPQKYFFDNFMGPHGVRTKKKCMEIMDFMVERGEIIYSMNGNYIEIDSYEIERRADAYTKEALRRLEMEREKEREK